MCALCVALAAGSFLLALLNGRSPREILIDEGIVAVATLAVAFSVVGALIASHRPANPIGWIFCAAAVFQGVSICGYEYATYALLTQPGSLPLGAEASWIAQWIWAPGLGLILVFLPLLFPDGRPPSRRWRPVAWLGGLSIGLNFVSAVVFLWPQRGPALVGPEGPAEEGASHAMFVVVEFAAFPMMLVAGLGAVVSLVIRFRRSRGAERQQIKWFAFASALTFAFVFVWEGMLGAESALLQALFAVLSVVLVPAIPVATGIAILRYRLYDIDRIINRALVYGILTAVLVLTYVGAVVAMQEVFRTLAGGESQLAVVASTLAIAALFGPLRRRVQTFIDRRLYRNKYDAARTLAAFNARLREETDLDELGDDLVRVVTETLQPAHASLWLSGPGPPRPEEARP
jgi:hypothetical protein